MKDKKTKYFWICCWLAIISILLLCGLILFASYVYKFDPLSTFTSLFQTDANVIWDAINVLATIGVGIATIVVSVRLASIQKIQSEIEKEQHQLYTEPHILIDSIEVIQAECELTKDGTQIKTLKNFDFPYYVNTLDDNHISNFSIISVTIVNTSEAFARLRFDEATIKHDENDIIAKYNISTFGAHKNHLMLSKDSSNSFGLLISNDLIPRLRGAKITVASFLDNNFNQCFWDEQSYHIMNVCEEKVTFMPHDTKQNVFKRIER